jgi:hypothetical protein
MAFFAIANAARDTVRTGSDFGKSPGKGMRRENVDMNFTLE